jgi:hypothetical protein
MRILVGLLAIGLALSLGPHTDAADYKTLRTLTAAAPTAIVPLPAEAKPSPVQFVRIVIHPKDGEAWAINYLATATIMEAAAVAQRGL